MICIFDLIDIIYAGVEEFCGFIDLALDTADDSDWTITLLTDLRAVGSAMGQLLFELPDPCELNDLLKACSALWSISHHHKLLVCWVRSLSIYGYDYCALCIYILQ